MTFGTGPRRRRWSEPSRTDDIDDDWLAGYRPASDEPDDDWSGAPVGDEPPRPERRSPTRDDRLPGEEPIFRWHEPPPGEVPPVPREEPILRYMTPPGRRGSTSPRVGRLPYQPRSRRPAAPAGGPPSGHRRAAAEPTIDPTGFLGQSDLPRRHRADAPEPDRTAATRLRASLPVEAPTGARPAGPRRGDAPRGPGHMSTSSGPARAPAPGGPDRSPTSGSLRPIRADTTGGLPRMSTTTSGSLRPIRIDPVKPMHKPRSLWTAALTTVAVLVMLAVCGLGTYFMVRDERNGPTDARRAGASASPAVQKRDISNRYSDPAPLTEKEVFPGPQLPAAPGEAPYQVVKTQASQDCKVAATDDLATLLTGLGCSQVVRAMIKSPDGKYLTTAGIFNLADEAGAVQAHEQIKPIVDGQKGRFTGLLAGPGTEVMAIAPMILGWHARGHFLAYCIIARADGKAFDPADPFPTRIQADILTTHLRDGVISARALVLPSTEPSGSPSGD